MKRLREFVRRLLRRLGIDTRRRYWKKLEKAAALHEKERIESVGRIIALIRIGHDTGCNVDLLFWLLLIGRHETIVGWPDLYGHYWFAVESREYRDEWHPLLLKLVCSDNGVERYRLVYELLKVMNRLASGTDVHRLFAELGVDPEPWNQVPDYSRDPEMAAIAG